MDEATKAVVEKYMAQLVGHETQAAKIKDRINGLYELEGEPIPYPDAGTPGAVQSLKTIRSDQFYGRKLATVVREILSARANHGAMPLDDLYETLKRGGYDFDGKDDATKKRILASSLGKNPIFSRVPSSGDYGLTEWYPSARKKTRNGDSADGDAGGDDSGEEQSDPNRTSGMEVFDPPTQ